MKHKLALTIMLLVFAAAVFSQQVPMVVAQPESHTVMWERNYTWTSNQRALARGSDGTLHCVYGADEIYYAYSIDNGLTSELLT